MHFKFVLLSALASMAFAAESGHLSSSRSLQRRSLGSCEATYGGGWVQCGTGLDCYNPTKGQTCCPSIGKYCRSGTVCAAVDGYCCIKGEDPATCASREGFALPPSAGTASATLPLPTTKYSTSTYSTSTYSTSTSTSLWSTRWTSTSTWYIGPSSADYTITYNMGTRTYDYGTTRTLDSLQTYGTTKTFDSSQTFGATQTSGPVTASRSTAKTNATAGFPTGFASPASPTPAVATTNAALKLEHGMGAAVAGAVGLLALV